MPVNIKDGGNPRKDLSMKLSSTGLILQFIDHRTLNFALTPVLSSTIQLALL